MNRPKCRLESAHSGSAPDVSGSQFSCLDELAGERISELRLQHLETEADHEELLAEEHGPIRSNLKPTGYCRKHAQYCEVDSFITLRSAEFAELLQARVDSQFASTCCLTWTFGQSQDTVQRRQRFDPDEFESFHKNVLTPPAEIHTFPPRWT